VTSHLGLLTLFSVFVAVVFAVLTRDDPKEQARFAARLFAGFLGAAIVLSWLMYALPL
jgi:hypothetical protein